MHNQQIENYMKSEFNQEKGKIARLGDEITRVSNNFKELEIFKGRFLRHIY